MLLVHGDEHVYEVEPTYAGVPNLTRLETYGDTASYWLRVTADPRSEVRLLLAVGNRLAVALHLPRGVSRAGAPRRKRILPLPACLASRHVRSLCRAPPGLAPTAIAR